MRGWLLDTNVISETRKSNPSESVRAWINEIAEDNLFISTVSIAELRFGANINDDLLIRETIVNWVEGSVRPRFASRTLGITEDVLLNWRIISRRVQIARGPTPPVDLLMAAVAWTHHVAIATRDVAPFVASGVPTINPFTGERFNGA